MKTIVSACSHPGASVQSLALMAMGLITTALVVLTGFSLAIAL